MSLNSYACTDKQPSIKPLFKNPEYKFKGPISVSELEKSNMIEISETHKTVPFGYANEDWLKFKSNIRSGDKIYFMSHSVKHFYIDGHALVRNGCIVDFLKGAIS